MTENIINTVLRILNKSEDEIARLYIEAKINEILEYTNRDKVSNAMMPTVCAVIAESLKESNISGRNVQSYSEGDMSISFSDLSPFYGRLEPFKLIRGIKKDVQE